MIRQISEQYDWDELLDNIAENNLTPIVGKEMYKFNDGGNLVAFDNYLAKKILKAYNVTDKPDMTLLQAVNFLEFDQKLETPEIIRRLKNITKETRDTNIEFPLLNEFLQITDLKYYINTAVYNNLLVDKINEIQKNNPTSINFSINQPFSDSEDLEKLSAPFVFNVFGSLTNTVDPALSEEDMLEFAGYFREKMSNAINILNALRNKNLLFLGCAYPEWLIRFALRLLSHEPIHDWGKTRTIYVINDRSPYREQQNEFLKNYKAVTYDGDTSEFVTELVSQWKNRNPNRKKNRSVFLSYTRSDVPALENLKKSLEEIGSIDCWYDKEKLNPGDIWKREIISNIRKADIFMPLISANSLDHENGYVQKEWTEGINTSLCRPDAKFLIPVVIDDSKLYGEKIKNIFGSDINMTRIPEGKPNQEFLDDIKKILKLD